MRPVPLRQARPVDAPTKLALVERLLVAQDVAECIEPALAWLVSHAGAERAMCALADRESGLLRGVAGHRTTTSDVEALSVALDDVSHPLVRAMCATEPTLLSGASGNSVSGPGISATPFGRSPFWAMPLGIPGAGQPADGLLLLVLNSAPSADVVWVTGVMSQKLHALLTRDVLAEGHNKFRRERSLLDAIINAVADPILLTDTEGRLLIANGRA